MPDYQRPDRIFRPRDPGMELCSLSACSWPSPVSEHACLHQTSGSGNTPAEESYQLASSISHPPRPPKKVVGISSKLKDLSWMGKHMRGAKPGEYPRKGEREENGSPGGPLCARLHRPHALEL